MYVLNTRIVTGDGDGIGRMDTILFHIEKLNKAQKLKRKNIRMMLLFDLIEL